MGHPDFCTSAREQWEVWETLKFESTLQLVQNTIEINVLKKENNNKLAFVAIVVYPSALEKGLSLLAYNESVRALKFSKRHFIRVLLTSLGAFSGNENSSRGVAQIGRITSL